MIAGSRILVKGGRILDKVLSQTNTQHIGETATADGSTTYVDDLPTSNVLTNRERSNIVENASAKIKDAVCNSLSNGTNLDQKIVALLENNIQQAFAPGSDGSQQLENMMLGAIQKIMTNLKGSTFLLYSIIRPAPDNRNNTQLYSSVITNLFKTANTKNGTATGVPPFTNQISILLKNPLTFIESGSVKRGGGKSRNSKRGVSRKRRNTRRKIQLGGVTSAGGAKIASAIEKAAGGGKVGSDTGANIASAIVNAADGLSNASTGAKAAGGSNTEISTNPASVTSSSNTSDLDLKTTALIQKYNKDLIDSLAARMKQTESDIIQKMIDASYAHVIKNPAAVVLAVAKVIPDSVGNLNNAGMQILLCDLLSSNRDLFYQSIVDTYNYFSALKDPLMSDPNIWSSPVFITKFNELFLEKLKQNVLAQ